MYKLLFLLLPLLFGSTDSTAQNVPNEPTAIGVIDFQKFQSINLKEYQPADWIKPLVDLANRDCESTIYRYTVTCEDAEVSDNLHFADMDCIKVKMHFDAMDIRNLVKERKMAKVYHFYQDTKARYWTNGGGATRGLGSSFYTVADGKAFRYHTVVFHPDHLLVISPWFANRENWCDVVKIDY